MSVDYRYKPEKHKFKENVMTIDEIHRTHLSTFKKNIEEIPKKKKELDELQKELLFIQENKKSGPVNLDIDYLKKFNKIKKNISDLELEINNIENYKDELEYYSKTGDVIYDYYDLTNGLLYDNFNKINKDTTNHNYSNNNNSNNMNYSNNDNANNNNVNNDNKINISCELSRLTNANRKRKLKKPIRKRNKKLITKPQKSIMSYLLNDDNKTESAYRVADTTLCKATLQNEYLIIMDKEYACTKAKTSPIRRCEKCNIDKVIIFAESIFTCPKCGDSEEVALDTDIPSYGDVFNEKPKYPYRRIGHCIEKLNQFLCKGNINIPSDVFNVLELEIEKHGLTKNKVTIKFLERILKKHKKSNYYEYIMYIYNKITNTPPKVLTQDEYDLILKMFMEANEIYENKYKPPNRNNFLKYTFVLHKIFMTIGKPEYAKYFKILKSETKLKEQEKIWKQICMDLGWKYHAGSSRSNLILEEPSNK